MSYDIEHARPAPRTHGAIAGTRCDGCRCMCVKPNERYRTKPPEFWCEHLHRKVDPRDVECGYVPGERTRNRKRRRFNGGKI